MKTKVILFCCLSCLFFACGDTTDNSPTGSLEVTFKARYGTRPLVMYQKYPYYKGLPMKIQAFSFFVNNLRWTSKGTSSKPENEVSLIDFAVTNTDSIAAEKGITLKYAGLPVGVTTIAFDIGVPKNINAKQPKDFDVKNSLSDGSYYWESWKSFIFTKLEGRVDTSGKGMYKNVFSFHTGLDESFRSITLPGTVSITDGGTTKLLIEVDSKTIFGLTDPPIDVVKNSESHTAANKNLMITLSDNYKSAFRIK